MVDFTAEDFDFGDNEQYWRKKLANQGTIKATPPRSSWQRFMEGVEETMRRGPAALISSVTAPLVETGDGKTYSQRRASMAAREKQRRANYDAKDPADSVGDYVIDLGSGITGSLLSDPTNMIGGPAKTLVGKMATAGGIGVGADAALQGGEILADIRDEYDPVQGAINAVVGPALMAGVHGASKGVQKYRAGRDINAGYRMDNFKDLEATVLRLEGGGTLANPKTSPKGAKGPMQVMDATARNPGFGIRPWNGKTEADRARVGRQYLAALNNKYKGDTAKVLAAYNGGPGRVDAAVAKYGSEWLRAMPLESRLYVRNGLGKNPVRGPQWEAADETFTNTPDEMLALVRPDEPEEELSLTKVADELIRKAQEEEELSFTMAEQPNIYDQQFANVLSEPVPEGPELNAEYFGLNDRAFAELQASKYKLDEIKAAEDYSDTDWAKLPLVVKQASLKVGKHKDAAALKLGDKYTTIAMADKEGISPGTPEFDKKYGYNQKPYDDEDFLFDEDDADEYPDYDEPIDDDYSALQPHYDYIGSLLPYDQYEKNSGKTLDLTQKKVIEEIAKEKGVHPWDVAEAYLNKDESVGLDVDEIAHKVGQLLKYYTKMGYEDGPVQVSKVSAPPKYFPEIGKRKTPPKPQSRLAKTVDTFVRMLKDDSGKLASDPENIHKAITEWERGTHYLLKEEDGTPLRIYHGTGRPYEGMPSAEKNRMPRGYIVYSTNPEFANGYTNHYGNRDAAPRVFPAYVKNDPAIGDFRKPEHVAIVKEWYRSRSQNRAWYSEPYGIETGAWDVWEQPELFEYAGWKGAFLTENGSLNIVLKPELIMPVLDPETYKNKSAGHKIVRVLKALLKDESGAYRGAGFDARDGVDAESRLTNFLKGGGLKRMASDQKRLYREARAEKFGFVRKLQEEGGGRENLYAQKKAMQGQLPRTDFESFAEHFTEEDFVELANKINFNKRLTTAQKFKALQALDNLLGVDSAKLPTPSEIKLLSEVYSPDLIRALLDNRDFMQKVWNEIGGAINIPRALMSSADFSAPFRQGIGFVHKPAFWKNIIPMFKLFGSEARSQQLMDTIKSDPDWEKADIGGLAILDPHSHFLADREEAFMTGAKYMDAEKIPLAGEMVRASNRAYTGFLNKLRFDVFKDMLKKYEAAGITPDDKQLKDIANFINTFTGRGDLGRHGNAAAPFLSAGIFSPRLIASRVKILASPISYAKADPILRKEAWKALIGYSAFVGTVLGIGSQFLGWDVEKDARSPDFAKLKKGNTRVDVTGGMQPYVRLVAQLGSHSKITGKGEEQPLGGGFNDAPEGPYDESLASVIGRFGRSKESPIASLIHNFFAGENIVGEPFKRTREIAGVNVSEELLERVVPMTVNDLFEVSQDEGFMKAVSLAPGGLMGLGIQTYDPEERAREKEEQKAAKKADKALAKEMGLDFDSEFSAEDFEF